MTSHYTADSNDNPALPATRGYSRTEELPYVLGNGAVRRMARELADAIISEARTLHGPVVWLTGNAYVPAMRSFPAAERVYLAENNYLGDLFAWFVELVEDHLSAAHVAMEQPDYDNALYAVDLNRWQYREHNGEHHPDFYESWDINDEWEPVDQHAVDDSAENPRE